MDKIFKILAVFLLLVLVIAYSVKAREKKFREFYFSRRINLPRGNSPDWTLFSPGILVEQEGATTAFDKENRLAFTVEDGNTLVISDESAGATVAILPLEENIDGLLFDPVERLIFCRNAEGSVNIFRQHNRETYRPVQHLPVPEGNSSMGWDAPSGKLFIYASGAIYLFTNK